MGRNLFFRNELTMCVKHVQTVATSVAEFVRWKSSDDRHQSRTGVSKMEPSFRRVKVNRSPGGTTLDPSVILERSSTIKILLPIYPLCRTPSCMSNSWGWSLDESYSPSGESVHERRAESVTTSYPPFRSRTH